MQKVCVELGLVCEECTSRTARQLAQTCKGLPSRVVSQMFVQLYPEPECSRMSMRFTAAYRGASEQAPKRRPVRAAKEMLEVAVACAS